MKRVIYTSLVLLMLMGYAQKSVAQQKPEKVAIEKAMIRALEWQEAHPIYSWDPTDWTNGAYYTGVARAHKATGNMVFIAALKAIGHYNQWKTWNRFYHADDVAISYSYLYVSSIQKRVVDLKPTDDFINDHLHKPYTWPVEGEPGILKNITWWWCDALFMAPPVLTVYAKQKNDLKYLDEMHNYYKQSYDLLFDKEEKLFARDTRFLWKGVKEDMKETNGKKIFWSRGNGWVIAGLALILEDMPKDYQHRAFYEDLFKSMAKRIKDLQQKDGMWRTSLLSPESFNHGEASGTGFHTFALAWGVNNGLLPAEEYKPAAMKSWKAILKCQQESGKVGWVQNIGSSPEPANAESWQNFGTGAFLLAGSEIIKF
jgi:unsaturated rhamnogalacturonyl hydrolase